MADHPMRNDPTNCRDRFAVPLGSLTSGSLRFTNGAHLITIRAESYMRGLCRALRGPDANDRGA